MKIKKLAMSASLMTCLAGVSLANAADVCKEVKADKAENDIGQMEIADCPEIWETLKASKKFPGIFSQPPKLLGLCYVSGPDGIRAQIDSKNVLVTTKSAWTTELIPDFANGGLGSIITEWVILNPRNYKEIGKIQSMETIDLTSSKEHVVIIDGNGKFSGAKGSMIFKSTPLDPFANQIDIDSISGTLCVPESLMKKILSLLAG